MSESRRSIGANYSDGASEETPAARVELVPGPSALARGWAYGVGGAGTAVALVLPVSAAVSGALGLLILAGTLRCACGLGCRNGRSVARRVVVARGGRVRVERAGGTIVEGQLLASTVVLTGLVMLRYRPEGGMFARTVILLPDAVERDAFRRLRMLLRCQ